MQNFLTRMASIITNSIALIINIVFIQLIEGYLIKFGLAISSSDSNFAATTIGTLPNVTILAALVLCSILFYYIYHIVVKSVFLRDKILATFGVITMFMVVVLSVFMLISWIAGYISGFSLIIILILAALIFPFKSTIEGFFYESGNRAIGIVNIAILFVSFYLIELCFPSVNNLLLWVIVLTWYVAISIIIRNKVKFYKSKVFFFTETKSDYSEEKHGKYPVNIMSLAIVITMLAIGFIKVFNHYM